MKVPYKVCSALILVVQALAVFPARAAGLESPQAPFVVSAAAPLDSLSESFVKTSGWTGSDAAYSVSLSPGRTLWLFGDTWIGRIKNGKRLKSSMMIANTVGLQTDSSLEFFWRKAKGKPAAFFKPEEEARWYWPLDGAIVDRKLYLFMNVLKKDTSRHSFQFRSTGSHLIRVSNPEDSPEKWEIKIFRMAQETDRLALGTACLEEGGYLYVYGTAPVVTPSGTKHRLVISRISKADLISENMDGWQYFSGSKWKDNPDHISVLLDQAAPEFTINRIAGIKGYVLTYMPAFGSSILLRHSEKPTGPWSTPVEAYRCPRPAKGEFYYSAKNHPELSSQDYELVITYCANTDSFRMNYSKPYIYCPKAVRVLLNPEIPASD